MGCVLHVIYYSSHVPTASPRSWRPAAHCGPDTYSVVAAPPRIVALSSSVARRVLRSRVLRPRRVLHPPHVVRPSRLSTRCHTCLEPSACYQVLGTKYSVAGTWYQLLGTKYFVPGKCYRVPRTWYQVHGTKFLVPGTWYQVLVTRYLVPSIWN